MRIALVGWDLDEPLASALANMGAEVFAFTRWYEGSAHRERRGGLVIVRCPHVIGGGLEREYESFRDAVIRADAELWLGGSGLDVAHALDRGARSAVGGLVSRYRHAVSVVSAERCDWSVAADRSEPIDAIGRQIRRVDLWIVDDPFVVERVEEKNASHSRIAFVPSPNWRQDDSHKSGSHKKIGSGPIAAFALFNECEIDTRGLARSLTTAREWCEGLTACVLGRSSVARRLRADLARESLLIRSNPNGIEPTPEQGAAWLAAASIVGVGGNGPATEAVAWKSRSRGIPIARIDAPRRDGDFLDTLLDAIAADGRAVRAVKAGKLLAHAAADPTGRAKSLISEYLNVISGGKSEVSAAIHPDPNSSDLQRAFLALGGTRLCVRVADSRSGTASWRVRAEDLRSALRWLGADAARARLALRLYDITDIDFHGTNAHSFLDIDLEFDEREREIVWNAPGRSVATCLGLRTPHTFHPLAFAGPTHFPREEPSNHPPSHTVKVPSRRRGG
jgi:hypothetical protein